MLCQKDIERTICATFKTSDPTGVQFNLRAQEAPFMTFMNGAQPAFGIIGKEDIGMTLFADQFPTEFMLETDIWYYALIAIDTNSVMRYKIWQEDNPDNNAYYEVKLVDLVDDSQRMKFVEQNWTFEVQMGNNAQFNMKELKVMDFSSIVGVE